MSNFGVMHIQEIVDRGDPLPALNQIDLHPFMRHPDIVEICTEHGVLLEVSSPRTPLYLPGQCRIDRKAWAPLARAMRFDHPVLKKVAKAHGKEPAQVLLRWGLQHVGLATRVKALGWVRPGTDEQGIHRHSQIGQSEAGRLECASIRLSTGGGRYDGA